MAAASKGRKERRKSGLKREGVVEAFASTIVSYHLTESVDLNTRLMAMIAAWRAEDAAGIGVSNINGWHSQRTLFARNDLAVRELAEHVRFALISYVKRFIPDFEAARRKSFLEGWVNIIGRGGYNVPHTHDEYQVSGCYYVSVPPTDSAMSGAIEFLNPASAVPAQGQLGHRMCPDHFRVSPKPGQVLIFPATLSHWVLPNEEEQERISIAFNLRVAD